MTKKSHEEVPPAFEPAKYELADLTAVQAVAAGTANEDQQRRAMKWIIESACDTYGLGWHPGGPHEASFVAGRRFSGMQIVKATKINVSALRKASNG